jgi:hypothetical protein
MNQNKLASIVLSANLPERIVSPNKFEGLVPGLDGLLELGVFDGKDF